MTMINFLDGIVNAEEIQQLIQLQKDGQHPGDMLTLNYDTQRTVVEHDQGASGYQYEATTYNDVRHYDKAAKAYLPLLEKLGYGERKGVNGEPISSSEFGLGEHYAKTEVLELTGIPTFSPLTMMFCEMSSDFRSSFARNYADAQEANLVDRERTAFASTMSSMVTKIGNELPVINTMLAKKQSEAGDANITQAPTIDQSKANFLKGLSSVVSKNNDSRTAAVSLFNNAHPTTNGPNKINVSQLTKKTGFCSWIKSFLSLIFKARKTSAVRSVLTFCDAAKVQATAPVKRNRASGRGPAGRSSYGG